MDRKFLPGDLVFIFIDKPFPVIPFAFILFRKLKNSVIILARRNEVYNLYDNIWNIPSNQMILVAGKDSYGK